MTSDFTAILLKFVGNFFEACKKNKFMFQLTQQDL